jgi:hypothetical protein
MTVIILCVVPKLCGAKSYQLFAPKPQAENLCPLDKGWGVGKAFNYLDTHKSNSLR